VFLVKTFTIKPHQIFFREIAMLEGQVSLKGNFQRFH